MHVRVVPAVMKTAFKGCTHWTVVLVTERISAVPKSSANTAGQSGQRYQLAERYACLMTGKEEFKDISVLSVVADARHVGANDWLNVIAYAPEKQMSFMCPQQAMKLEWMQKLDNLGTAQRGIHGKWVMCDLDGLRGVPEEEKHKNLGKGLRNLISSLVTSDGGFIRFIDKLKRSGLMQEDWCEQNSTWSRHISRIPDNSVPKW